ncbi:ABC transporter substrate-binding protein [Spirillospora albida]|uniref:ABC transporter substrate-binding protein n=1 Tax=Spirillospora albida TaxID=58123 RepID=UPI00068B04C1|nr:ABC transporter substrate-binding protein [Spirillospora albida]
MRRTATTLVGKGRAGAARAGTRRAGAALVVAAGLVAAGLGACSDEEPARPAGSTAVAKAVGPGEGALSIVALAGAIEAGTADPRVDWVAPFQKQTGCKVAWKIAKDGGELIELMRQGGRRYDGVAAPPEVAGRLIAERQVAPVNTALVDGYTKLEPRLRDLLKREGTVYGVPYVWGTNVLMYDTRTVPPPGGRSALFDPDQARRWSGRIVLRDDPMTIAEAALYLKAENRKLKIRDPFALTPRQLAAAKEVLASQRPHVKAYWREGADVVSAFAGGTASLGMATSHPVDVLTRAGRPVQGALPSEGVTGWTDAWLIGARAEHPNCMYQWLRWTASPDVQRQVAAWNGVAPANPQACTGDRLSAGFCAAHRVGDRGHIGRVVFAHAPVKECGKDPEKRECTDYAEWTKAWIEATQMPPPTARPTRTP